MAFFKRLLNFTLTQELHDKISNSQNYKPEQ